MKSHQIFVSYTHSDRLIVRSLVEWIRRELDAANLGVELWFDMQSLSPGDSWEGSIESAIRNSIGSIVFVSRGSLSSPYVRAELSAVTNGSDKLVIPVLIDEVHDEIRSFLPELVTYQWLDLSSLRISDRAEYDALAEDSILLAEATDRIVLAVERYLADLDDPPKRPSGSSDTPFSGSSDENVPSATTAERASEIAEDLRASVFPKTSASLGADKANPAVFLVHGHDTTALEELTALLRDLNVRPVILAREERSQQNLLQHFMAVAGQAEFAIVLVSADDFGASVSQYDSNYQGHKVGERALQYRARQNVILELGFFYGHLGFDRVFVVSKDPPAVFPNFEWPSDLAGMLWDSFSDPNWRKKLKVRLEKADLI